MEWNCKLIRFTYYKNSFIPEQLNIHNDRDDIRYMYLYAITKQLKGKQLSFYPVISYKHLIRLVKILISKDALFI